MSLYLALVTFVRVFPMLNINKPERRGPFCSLLVGMGGEGRGGCACAHVGSREQFVNQPQSRLVTVLSVQCSAFHLACCRLMCGSHGLHVLAFTPLRDANSHRGDTQNKVQAWCPGDACLRPTVLVQLDTVGILLGESLSWDWIGLVHLSGGCLCKVPSPCGGL